MNFPLFIASMTLGVFLLYDRIYGENQREKIMKFYCGRENRRDILKESFYDDSKKAEHIKNVKIMIQKSTIEIKKRIAIKEIEIKKNIAIEQEFYKEDDLHTEYRYLRDLLTDIEFDRYQYELLDMTREDRRLDDWDSF